MSNSRGKALTGPECHADRLAQSDDLLRRTIVLLWDTGTRAKLVGDIEAYLTLRALDEGTPAL